MSVAVKGRPVQAELRRAVSTAYYAMFHCLARCCADTMVGGSGSNRSNQAWRQIYRALQHGDAKNACANKNVMAKFPIEIQDFATQFVTMQKKRHHADYDPTGVYYRSAVVRDISATQAAITAFIGAPIKDRRAFAAWVLFKERNP
jgi:hypothetical protein